VLGGYRRRNHAGDGPALRDPGADFGCGVLEPTHDGKPQISRDYPVRRTPRSGHRHRQAAGVVPVGAEGLSERFWEFFTANIRNRNTRRAYYKASCRFSGWCEGHGLHDLARVKPIHVATFIEELLQELSKPTVKQHLAALRMLFDWLVVGHIIDVNPAHAVRGPKHRGWVRLHEKGGKRHDVPANHNLDEYLEAYIKGIDLETDPKGPLFRTAVGKSNALTRRPLSQADAYRMIQRRAKGAGIHTKIGNHTFRATGITAYLRNGGRLEVAQQIAAHESSRTTGLYDRRGDDVSLDEVELIRI
jgi:site-specific recombinase XerD